VADVADTRAEQPGTRRSTWWVLRPVLVAAVLAFGLYECYGELAEDFRISGEIAAFDARVASVVHGWRTASLTPFFKVVTSLANGVTVWVVATLVVLFLLLRRRWAEAVLLAVTVGVGTRMGSLAKHTNGRPRPPVSGMLISKPGGYSFPSGHALAATLLYGVIAFLILYEVRIAWVRITAVVAGLVLIVLVSLSRIYLGVHWPSDVVASWCLGGAWLVLCCGTFVTWDRWRRSRGGATSAAPATG